MPPPAVKPWPAWGEQRKSERQKEEEKKRRQKRLK
jgi:hypothetical protein